MKFFVPTHMDKPEEIDKDSFLKIMLKERPEYAIVWDVHGRDIQEFQKKVYLVQYVVISDNKIYYSESRHYATRAKTLFNLEEIIYIKNDAEWEKLLPPGEKFKEIKFYAPEMVDELAPVKISLEELINKLLAVRPPYAVLWNVTEKDVEYIVSRVYVVSFFYVLNDILHYSYGKHFAYQVQKNFNISNRIKKVDIQNPKL